ncbi:hypothetical protein C8R48DRAFT_778620 [Suillus tomentosus]|nr:hypothetical protein C8R48DRAFT_778620 [Suillus tomentosus]
MASANIAPSPSFAFGIPHSTGQAHHHAVEFTMVAMDANNYQSQHDTLKRMEARIGALTSDVSDLTENALAQKATLNATHQLAQDSLDSSERTRIHLQGMDSTMTRIGDNVAVMKSEIEDIKVILAQLRDAVLTKPREG